MMKLQFLSKEEHSQILKDLSSPFFDNNIYFRQDEQLKEIKEKLMQDLNTTQFTKEEFRRLILLLEVYNVTDDTREGVFVKREGFLERDKLISRLSKKFNELYHESYFIQTEQNLQIARKYGEI